jgi:flagellar basal-body rod modification protein FlgD
MATASGVAPQVVSGTTPLPTKDASGASLTSTAGSTLAGNFQTFLTLLTTQLQNQNPLDPLDTNQFTQQLVQFASVEQQLKTNDTLSSLLASTQASTTANAASFMGLSVTADGTSASLSGGSASWSLNAPKAVAKATITITDANGTVVTTKSTSLPAGEQTFTWDGKDAGGTLQADGSYTISVSGTDASGQAVSVSSDVSGTVTAVDVSGTTPVLTVNGTNVSLSSVKTIASQ